jgi:hypothetical protein
MPALGPTAIAFAVLVPLAACDLTQKPQTLTIRAGVPVTLAPQQHFSAPAAPGVGVRAPGEPDGGASVGTDIGGDRSIRLYGPGVSRHRQTRV